jgi:hypothetical protein
MEGMGDSLARFEELLNAVQVAPDQIPSKSAIRNVLVIAEPWSGDVLYNLPPLLKLAEADGWQVRIFRRDAYPDLIQPYLKDGLYRSIPVFVFYDADFNELAHWVERPAEATRVIDEESLKLRRRLRAEHEAEWRQETLKELNALANPRAINE